MRLFLLLCAFVVLPVAAMADPAEIARNFAKEFVVPRFQAVATATHVQQQAWTTFCARPKKGRLQSLTAAFSDLSDAWADVEFMRIGPGATSLRIDRFNWWLDRTDSTGKALTAMLAAKPEDLTVEKLASGSVAGQGLPIIERLLFPKSEAAKLQTKAGAQRCAVGLAAAREQASIADQIVGDWNAPDGALAALMDDKPWKFSFANAGEAASVMMTDLIAGLEGLKDLKVAMEFHDIMNAKAIRLAEANRSDLTLRDIERNLAAIRLGLSYFLQTAAPAQKAQLDAAFDDASNALKVLEDAKTDPARVEAVKKALAVFGTLSQTAVTIVPQATGLTLGFNSLDGD